MSRWPPISRPPSPRPRSSAPGIDRSGNRSAGGSRSPGGKIARFRLLVPGHCPIRDPAAPVFSPRRSRWPNPDLPGPRPPGSTGPRSIRTGIRHEAWDRLASPPFSGKAWARIDADFGIMKETLFLSTYCSVYTYIDRGAEEQREGVFSVRAISRGFLVAPVPSLRAPGPSDSGSQPGGPVQGAALPPGGPRLGPGNHPEPVNSSVITASKHDSKSSRTDFPPKRRDPIGSRVTTGAPGTLITT